jgi:Predicted esterase of the alpha/beta hydrolase fold
MTKRATILHGTGNKLTDHWLPWAKQLFEGASYEVFMPILPDNMYPDKDKYDKFLRESGWDFADNVIVGYSSGATTILNLLMSDWFPHARAVALVGAFLNEKLVKSASWYIPGQFDNLFLPEYKPEVIKQKADRFYFIHGSDDPYCDIDDAKQLCQALDGTFTTIPNGGHLGILSKMTALPAMEQVLRRGGII